MRFGSRRARNPFESRTQVWREVGLGGEIDRARAQRARGGALALVLLIAAVLFVFEQRRELLPGADTELRIAGLDAGTLAVGGAFTAVVLGLAAQQTLGNLFAGLVLLSTRPFRVGERVRFTGARSPGASRASSARSGSSIRRWFRERTGPWSRTASCSSSRWPRCGEPERVEMRARFEAQTTPAEVRERLAEGVSVPTRDPPDITLEELDRDEVVVKIVATPLRPVDGARLAAEVLEAVRA
jgi:hypothetical protein